MKLSLSEILKKASEIDNIEHRRRFLQQNDSHALRQVFFYAMNPHTHFLLPKSDPPYKPSQFPDSHGMLYTQIRKLYLFVEGGNNNLSKTRREALFIEMLETVSPDDAKLLLAIKNKTLPYPGFQPNFIRTTFPGLLPEPQQESVE